MKRTLYAATAAVCLCLAPPSFSADEQQAGPVLDVSQVPDAVQATLKKEGGRVDKIEKETESGKTFYEATVSKSGKNYVLRVADDGKVIKRDDMKVGQ